MEDWEYLSHVLNAFRLGIVRCVVWVDEVRVHKTAFFSFPPFLKERARAGGLEKVPKAGDKYLLAA